MIDFARPDYLHLLWAMPLVIVWLIWCHRKLRHRVNIFYGSSARSGAIIFSGRTFFIRSALYLTSFVALLLALAQPRWGYDWVEIERRGSDVLVLLDVSKSMLAEDVSPNRLERARRKVIDLTRMAEGDRIGVVAFAGSAFLAVPLTSDYEIIRTFLPMLTTDYIPTPGTNFRDAISAGLKALENASSLQNRSQAMVIISDGEDHIDGLEEVIDRAKKGGIKIHAMGVGTTQGVPIPVKGGFHRNRAGEVVITRLEEDILRHLARSSGGSYSRSVPGDADWQLIYTSAIRGGPLVEATETVRERRWRERYSWLLFVALAALLLEPAIRYGQRRAMMQGLVLSLALFGFGFPYDKAFSDHVRGGEAYQRGDFDQAIQDFANAEIDAPERFEHTYNRAVAAYRAGRFEEAARGFSYVAENATGELAERARFNHANALAMNNELQGALEAYEEALQHSPADPRIQENMDYIRELLEQQPPEQGEGESDQNEQPSGDEQQDPEGSQDQQSGESNHQQRDADAGDKVDLDHQDQQVSDEGSDRDAELDDQAESSQQEEEVGEAPLEGDQRSMVDSRSEVDFERQEVERQLRSLSDPIEKYHSGPNSDGEKAQVEKDW